MSHLGNKGLRSKRASTARIAALFSDTPTLPYGSLGLEGMNLLPSVCSENLKRQLPYRRNEDFLEATEDFCERVRNEEFVEYGAGYDPDEGEYHGFGDDSWIEEMDVLFEAAELYFLARHYGTVEKAYQLLFACLEIESDEGGYYFTTSDPQTALSTDLLKARKRYFDSLCYLYTGETLAERIIEDLGEYRYIGLHSVTRAAGREASATQYPEIARRLNQPSEFIKQLREELFQEGLPESDRDRQIDWIVQILRPRIDQIVSSKAQHAYADAARDAKLIEELYRFQGRSDKAHSFIAGLHTQYQRHRNFRAELKKLGLGIP